MLFSEMAAPFYFPPTVHKASSTSTSLSTLFVVVDDVWLVGFVFLDSNHPSGCEVCNPIFNDSVIHWLYYSLLNN